MKSLVIHIVDDDPWVRVAIRRILRLRGHAVWEHESAESFLTDRNASEAACVLLDLRMPGLSGLQLQAELERRGIDVPLIFLTAHGDVTSGVTAMKHGAIDFLQKPVREEDLLQAIDRALAKSVAQGDLRVARDEAKERLDQLTAREREVLELVVSGRRNRQIADEMGITEQTVKVHRMRAMAKLELSTVPDLMRLWETSGEPLPPPAQAPGPPAGDGEAFPSGENGRSREGRSH
jgi:RNA polymerase sigma factor (sigma-70 family)